MQKTIGISMIVFFFSALFGFYAGSIGVWFVLAGMAIAIVLTLWIAIGVYLTSL